MKQSRVDLFLGGVDLSGGDFVLVFSQVLVQGLIKHTFVLVQQSPKLLQLVATVLERTSDSTLEGQPTGGDSLNA